MDDETIAKPLCVYYLKPSFLLSVMAEDMSLSRAEIFHIEMVQGVFCKALERVGRRSIGHDAWRVVVIEAFCCLYFVLPPSRIPYFQLLSASSLLPGIPEPALRVMEERHGGHGTYEFAEVPVIVAFHVDGVIGGVCQTSSPDTGETRA